MRNRPRFEICRRTLLLAAAAALACGPPVETSGKVAAQPRVVQAPLSKAASSYVSASDAAGSFVLAAKGQAAPLVVSSSDYAGVRRVLGHLQADIQRVTSGKPQIAQDQVPAGASQVVLVGTLGKSALIDGLVSSGKLDVADIRGRWESFAVQVVDAPLSGIERALVIAGSDKRGTIYGLYDLSAQLGVSPWYYWADVPSAALPSAYVRAGRYVQSEPAVKYRGIFINDENPALSGWARATFGGCNQSFYDKVFELMSRLRANYLWPAMWGKSFATDDPGNPALADEYGIIIGTSHHEPMMRAQAEWAKTNHTTAQWNYDTDKALVQDFWRGGIVRMGSRESIVTMGMRGDGDLPLAGADVPLMEQIVGDQRAIISEVTGKPASSTPQVWALYKEVQDFYDQGMKVPDDVTLLLSDDNFGNVRRLPALNAPARGGGYGIYYHFDYVGGPRSYRWLNTNPLPRIWEQLELSYALGADRMWIVNVGDLKPMELPTAFFLDLAWDPKAWSADGLPEYTRRWAEQQFGAEHALAIAEILTRYTQYNARRKPELLGPDTYSLANYGEAERIVAEYDALAEQAQAISDQLPSKYRDAYFELVLYPVKACANLNELYVTAAKNTLYAKQGRAATNGLAKRAAALFQTDADLSDQYNTRIAGGKWIHMMDQTHIGYTSWDAPTTNVMPSVQTINLPAAAQLGIAIDGSVNVWPTTTAPAQLPELSPYLPDPAERHIDVFNRGTAPFEYTISSPVSWLEVEPSHGQVDQEVRLSIRVPDWQKAPFGRQEVPIAISGPNGSRVTVTAVVDNPETPRPEAVEGYVESDGYVSIEAERYTAKIESNSVTWQIIPDFGRTQSGVTPLPVTAPSQIPGPGTPHLEYRMHLFSSGKVTVQAYAAPTLDFQNKGLRYAIAFDDDPPQLIDIDADASNAAWSKHVSDNVNLTTSTHALAKAGDHVLKFWMVDPGVVLEKLVVDTGGVRASYLGPPASALWNSNAANGGAGGSPSANGGDTTGNLAGSPGEPSGAPGAGQGSSSGRPGNGNGCACGVAGQRNSPAPLTALALIAGCFELKRRRTRRSRQS